MHVPFIIFHFDLLIRSQRHGGNKQTNSFYCKIQLIKLFNWCCRLINRILAVGCTSSCRKENEWKADKSVIEKSLNKHQDWVFAIFNTSRAEWSGCKGLSKRFSSPFYFYEDLFKRRKKTATTTALAVWVILKPALLSIVPRIIDCQNFFKMENLLWPKKRTFFFNTILTHL